ncbi:oxidoreductase [Phenylobacterium deserti]|uniref:D-xylose 1-dehydrogenase n=1 Tax=Phenylobacterium deserti TaxID=1914756 RepID=A0A328AR86_9CAUL|nr:oxidoreductase [Phenylobacterium deserti]RAK56805.1 short-chain dehydrogenase/reductase [Phenylobacterium deserti]
MSKIWFITGAARGLGAQFAKAALAAGAKVVVTARRREALVEAFGPDGDNLLSLALDVTQEAEAQAAVDAALARFGRIDVLVNNAGFGNLGLFEETTDAQARAQYDTNVFGTYNVTRAVLPAMRAQRSGHVFNISSVGGLLGGEGGSLYCATKFAVEGFSESIAKEVAPFGIRVTVVEPGFFRTDFLDSSSLQLGARQIADYAELSARMKAFWEGRNHAQAGDPAKLAKVLVQLADKANPPLRFAAGTDALAMIEGKIMSLKAELDRFRDLSASTDSDDAVRTTAVAGAAWL